MGIRTLINPTCRELAERLSSGAYDRASFLERLAVRWHLARCELCRIYAAQVKLVGDAFRRRAQEPSPEGLKSRLLDKVRKDLDR